MAQFQNFDLGKTLTQAEQINNLRASRDPNSTGNQLNRQRLTNAEQSNQLARTQEQRTQSAFDQNQSVGSSAQVADSIKRFNLVSQNPALGSQHVDIFKQRGLLPPDFDINRFTPEQISSEAAKASQALQQSIGSQGAAGFSANTDIGESVVISTDNTGNVIVKDFGNNILTGEAAINAVIASKEAGLDKRRIIAEIKSNQAGASEGAKLDAQLAGKPIVEAAITKSKAEATAAVAEKVEKKRLSKAFKTYEVGRDNLKKALKNTLTGPIFGRLPAATAASQIADNAKATMLPILKAIVRGGGEGVFTDQDAAAVLALIPDRITDEAAMDQIFTNIDAFISSKLGQSDGATATNPAVSQVLRFDAQGNQIQ
jgi:hypothetical protein